jgi:pimeloyl-ACP methyl ester carboxylesterase
VRWRFQAPGRLGFRAQNPAGWPWLTAGAGRSCLRALGLSLRVWLTDGVRGRAADSPAGILGICVSALRHLSIRACHGVAAGRPAEGSNTMQDFNRGTVRVNNLTFTYLTEGDGPLALCVHGFPDSPYSYRYLLPALAEAGYRAVAPFNRGFAPTELPDDRHHIHSSMMVNDQIALHEALGGDSDAILIAHDWGAVGAWGAAGKEPDRWRRCVVLNIPPFAIFGENIVKYDQIKRSFYFWYFQMQRVCEDVISADNFAFIDRIWADWSPGYDASEDLPKVKECIRDPAHFRAALGYYWGQFDPDRFGSEEWAAEQAAAWGKDITQPTLYLHGTQDGCHGCDQDQVNRVPDHCGPGSQSELIDGVGHFLMVQRPTDINKRILDFLRA